nr:MAG TPA: hypothetical protein [Caudoviricetes sp.]
MGTLLNGCGNFIPLSIPKIPIFLPKKYIKVIIRKIIVK